MIELVSQTLLNDEAIGWVGRASLRLGAAAVLGALIGSEREYSGRSAGMRTQLLVGLGSALAMLVSLEFAAKFAYQSAGGVVHVDPARVAYGVMGGIGFIGAGAILRYGPGVRGLTTAASLWCTAAVGLACGFGMYSLAVLTTVLVLIALTALAKLETYIPTRRTRIVTIVLPIGEQDNVERLRSILKRRGVRIRQVQCTRDLEAKLETIVFHITSPSRLAETELMRLDTEAPEICRLSVQ